MMAAETFGQRLKRLRESTGLSQHKLADLAGVPIGTLRGAEYDRREPKITTAAKIADALGVTLDVLAGRGSEPAPETPKRKGKK